MKIRIIDIIDIESINLANSQINNEQFLINNPEPEQKECYSLINQIDKNLGLHYKKQNVNYYSDNGIGKFQLWCEENGFDNDNVEEELKQIDLDDCFILDFDPNFPIPSYNMFHEDKRYILSKLLNIADIPYQTYTDMDFYKDGLGDLSANCKMTQFLSKIFGELILNVHPDWKQPFEKIFIKSCKSNILSYGQTINKPIISFSHSKNLKDDDVYIKKFKNIPHIIFREYGINFPCNKRETIHFNFDEKLNCLRLSAGANGLGMYIEPNLPKQKIDKEEVFDSFKIPHDNLLGHCYIPKKETILAYIRAMRKVALINKDRNIALVIRAKESELFEDIEKKEYEANNLKLYLYDNIPLELNEALYKHSNIPSLSTGNMSLSTQIDNLGLIIYLGKVHDQKVCEDFQNKLEIDGMPSFELPAYYNESNTLEDSIYRIIEWYYTDKNLELYQTRNLALKRYISLPNNFPKILETIKNHWQKYNFKIEKANQIDELEDEIYSISKRKIYFPEEIKNIKNYPKLNV